jgi:hypothetical protein
MKRENKHMDNVFRDRLGDVEISAPSEAWENISTQINIRSKKDYTFLYKIAAAVAAIAIIGSLYMVVSKDQIVRNENVVSESLLNNTEKEINAIEKENVEQIHETKNDEIIADLYYGNEVSNISEPIIDDDNSAENTQVTNNVIEREKDVEDSELIALLPIDFDFDVLKPELVISKTKNPVNKNEFVPDMNLLLALNIMEAEKIEKEKKSKWMIGGDFTPLYSYRSISKSNSNYDAAYYNSVESPMMTYTGGLNLQYKALGRLSIQAGVYYSSMGQSLDYMTVYSNNAYDMVAEEYKDRFVNSYEIDNSAGAISFKTSYVIIDELAARVNDMSSNKGFVNTADPVFQDLDAEIQQSFKYIEVPVILRYKLIDKEIDFNIIGGIGANFLIGNDVILSYGNTKEVIGETKGVDPVNYSGSFGFGIEYPLMKRIKLKLEPSIKYYLNSINSNSSIDSHPYSIGIYTGINYTF